MGVHFAVYTHTNTSSIRGDIRTLPSLSARGGQLSAYEQTGVHIAIISHTGKDPKKGARGSNAQDGDVDVMVQIAGDAIKVATVTKANDQEEGVLTKFRAEIAVLGTDEDGADITTAIISDDPCGSADVKSHTRAKLTQIERRALDMLTNAVVDIGKDPPSSGEFPWKVKVVPLDTWRTYCKRGGLSDNQTDDAFRTAFKRVTISLANKHRIGNLDGWVWIAQGRLTNEQEPRFGQKRAQTTRYCRTFRTPLLTSEHFQNVRFCSVARQSASQVLAKNALKRPDITEHFRTCSNIVRFVRLSNHRTSSPPVYKTGGIVRGTAWVVGRRKIVFRAADLSEGEPPQIFGMFFLEIFGSRVWWSAGAVGRGDLGSWIFEKAALWRRPAGRPGQRRGEERLRSSVR